MTLKDTMNFSERHSCPFLCISRMFKLRSSRDNNWFGRRLKVAREAAKISQEELAERVDLTRLTIARYESGRLRPNFERLEPLAAAVSQPLWWFFTDQDEKPKYSATFEEFCTEVLNRLSVLEERVADNVSTLGQLVVRENAEEYVSNLGEMTQRSLEQGLDLLRESILDILEERFGSVSPAVVSRLREIQEPGELRNVVKLSATAPDLTAFLGQL